MNKIKSLVISESGFTFDPCNTAFLQLLIFNYTYQKQTAKAQQVQEKIDILK